MRPQLWSTGGPQGEAVLVLPVDRHRFNTDATYHAAVEAMRSTGIQGVLDLLLETTEEQRAQESRADYLYRTGGPDLRMPT